MSEDPESGALVRAFAELRQEPDAELRRARAHAHRAIFGETDDEPLTIGRYRLLANIGRGGLGNVWAAHDPHLDRVVAVKLLRDDALRKHPRARAQLLAEAAIMARLTHPNVVRVYDLGDAGGELFVAMEYVEGQTLRAWQTAEPHDWRELLEVYLQAGEGLAAAHAAGLVHGDFKPDNVLIGNDGRVLVSDFGVAPHVIQAHVEVELSARDPGSSSTGEQLLGDEHLQSEDESLVTARHSAMSQHALAVVGTPAYMAPEQLDGSLPDVHADQFAFCIALWEALLGDRPFAGRTISGLREAISQGVREPEHTRRVTPRLLALLRRGLSERPDQRYPTLDALLSDLRRLHARRRRWSLVGVLAAFVGSGVAGLTYGLMVEAPGSGEGCPIVEASEQLGWSPERREQIAQALQRGERALEPARAEELLAKLDTFVTRWSGTRARTCLHLKFDGDEGISAFHDRALCMYAASAAFEAATEVLSAAEVEADLVARPLISSLPDPFRCVDASREEPGEGHGSGHGGFALRERIARARALRLAQRHEQALALCNELVVAARELNDRSLLGQVELERGIVLARTGELREGLRVLQRASSLAEVSGDRQTALAAADNIAHVHLQLAEQPSELEAWAERTLLLAQRLNEPIAAMHARMYLGHAALRLGRADEALALQHEALTRAEQELGTDNIELAYAHDFLGGSYGELGQLEPAIEHKRIAIAILERELGPDHMDVAVLLGTAANVHAMLGQREQARGLYERAWTIMSTQLGEQHRRSRLAARRLADFLYDEGEPERAEALLADDTSPWALVLRASWALHEGRVDDARPLVIELSPGFDGVSASEPFSPDGLTKPATTSATKDDPYLWAAKLELRARLALADGQLALARSLARAITSLSMAVDQRPFELLAVLLDAEITLREQGSLDPGARQRLTELLARPGVDADRAAQGYLLLWQAAAPEQREAARQAALAAVGRAFGERHPIWGTAGLVERVPAPATEPVGPDGPTKPFGPDGPTKP